MSSQPSSMPSFVPPVHGGKHAHLLGRGIGKKGGGKSAKRFRNQPKKDPFLGITKPSIRRLCRKGGVKRIGTLIYEEVRGLTKSILENILTDALAYVEHARRKTITYEDVVYAFKRQGITLYGFSDPKMAKHAYTKSAR